MIQKQKGLTGLWIPLELLCNKNLSYTEMILFAHIRLLDNDKGCFASNKHLAKILDTSSQTITNGIGNLLRLGYLEKIVTGRKRTIKIDLDYKKVYSKDIKKFIGKLKKNLYTGNNMIFNNKKLKTKELSSYEDNEDSENPQNNLRWPHLEINKRKTRINIKDAPMPALHKKQVLFENASIEAKEILKCWNSCRTLTTHFENTKTTQKALQFLDIFLLRKHTKETIKRAIKYFEMMRIEIRLYKIPSRKISLEEFLKGSSYLKAKTENEGKKYASWFELLYRRESYFKYSYLYVEDDYPEYTKTFRKRYEKHVLVQEDIMYTPKQITDFIGAGRELNEYMKKGRLEKYVSGSDWKDYIHRFFEALADQYGATRIIPGHLCSVNSWNNVFPRYLSRHWET